MLKRGEKHWKWVDRIKEIEEGRIVISKSGQDLFTEIEQGEYN